MAVFDPEIPQSQSFNTLGYSRAYEGVSPFAVAVKGVGDVLGNALQGADTVVKTIIENGMRKDLGDYQEQKTSEFETIAGTPPALRSTVMPPLNILPSQPDANGQESQPLPGDASQSLDRSLGTIAAGKKLRPYLSTYYDAGADKIVKDYQYRFPGYDKEIMRIAEQKLGIQPANKLVNDLISIIQAGSDGEKSNLEKARTLLEKFSGRTGEFNGQQIQAWQMMQIINSNMVSDPLSHVMRFISKHDELKAKQDDAHSNATNLKDTNEVNVDRASKAVVDIAASQAGMMWNDSLGTIPGMTPDRLNEVISKAQRGEDIGLNSNELEILASSLEDKMRLGRMNIRQKVKIPGQPGEEPIYKYVNGAALDTQINAGFQDIADMRDALRSKDVGLIGRTARYLTNKLNDSRYNVANDPKLGPQFIGLDTMNTFGGPQVSGALATQYLRGGIVQDLTNYFDRVRVNMMTPPREGERQFNLLDVVNDAEAKKIGIKLPTTDPRFRPNAEQEREFYDKVLQFPGAVLNNPKLRNDLKAQVARASFSNETLGLIGKFEDDRNKIKAWNYLTDKNSVVLPLKKLVESGADPYAWREAKSWADQEFRRFLFTDSINNLKTYNQPTIGIGYRPATATEPPSFYAYQKAIPGGGGDDPFFSGLFESAAAHTKGTAKVNPYYRAVEADLAKLNAGIRGVSNYIQADGGDPNHYVLKTMIDAGFDPKTATGIPGEMMKALAAPMESMDPFKTKTQGKSQKKPYE